MNEKRKQQRTNGELAVTISHESFGSKILSSRNISKDGVFIVCDLGLNTPLVGSILDIQIQGFMEQDIPSVPAEVVRIEDNGLALRFLEDMFAGKD